MRWRKIKHGNPAKTTNDSQPKVRYAGFWSRVMGFTTDLFIIGMPISLLMMFVFGYDETKTAGAMDVIMQNEEAITNAPDPMASIMQIVLSLAIYTVMWRNSGQTPGKKMARTRVVDAKTFELASWPQLIVRFIGYLLSAVTLVGFFIGLLRKDKRTLHDLISRTAVIYE